MAKRDTDKPKSNPFMNGLISTFFDLIKHFMYDFENMKKAKKVDKMSEEFSTLEHMMIRLEKKLDDNRHDIEDLKNRILWGNIVIVILVLVNLFYLIK